METPAIVSPEWWATAHKQMLVKEKAHTHARDALMAERRRMPFSHLHARDTTLAYVSRAAQTDIARLKKEMGWTMPWYTLADGFDADFGVDERHGHNAFICDGERIYRTYFINGRGDEAIGTVWSYLDMTALGRQEIWEDSPKGYPQSRPYKWWNWHDSYVPGAPPDPKWVEVSDAGEAAFRNKSRFNR